MKLYDLSNNDEKQNLINTLTKAMQSCNLNFLLGSGASMPAINTLGNVEIQVEALLKDEKSKKANKQLIEFLKQIYAANNDLLTTDSENMEITKNNYKLIKVKHFFL